MERGKKKSQTRRPKAPTKLNLATKSMMVKSAEKSTQVKNIALEHVKARISDTVKSWLNSQPNFDPAENEKEAYSDLIHGLYEELKLSITADQLKILKLKQIELEYRVVSTFMMASTYLALAKFPGFARTFQYLARKTVSLIFSLGSGIDLSENQTSTFQPNWQSWNNLVDAINEGLKAERMTIDNFEKLQDLIPETDQVILDKKLSIVKRIQNVMDLFKNTSKSEDFFMIDKKLNKRI